MFSEFGFLFIIRESYLLVWILMYHSCDIFMLCVVCAITTTIIGATIRTHDNVLKALSDLAQVRGKDYHIRIVITLILQVYTCVSMFVGCLSLLLEQRHHVKYASLHMSPMG